ncbi:drug/metabolite exporter YedA [Actinokineospora sp. UTMC 2448]|uniref:drug/metabolite exporter YedA n=1 Tax=Actinokineospora sp. UTMC 2448 TaxID=2268449 RepID=UPI00216485A5|nr:drug/metabolite exporter YedA [Actinokineospora sp. UTMC 2448]
MNTGSKTQSSLTPTVIAALIIVYIVWGSTYLAIDLTLATMPPFIMTGMRFLAAGIILATFLLIRGYRLPTGKQWLNCAIIGALMQGGCVGSIAIAQQSITSGLAAVGIATVPIWTALLAGAFTRRWPNHFEVVGIAFGFIGVIALNVEGGISGASKGAIIIVVAALCWSIGSVLSQHVELPAGPMAYAGEMLAGGAITALAGLAFGESFSTMPDAGAIWSWVYLVVAGSLGAYSAYMYLLKTVRTALATSYTLVTPAIAVLLGWWFLSEDITLLTVLAVAAVICGVGFIFKGRAVKSKTEEEAKEPSSSSDSSS